MARLFDREKDLGDSLFVSTDGRRFRLRSPGLGCRGSVITLSAEEANALVAYIKQVRVIDPAPDSK
jgi:hypothetical protein